MPANHCIADFRVVLHVDFANHRCALFARARHGQRRVAGTAGAQASQTLCLNLCGAIAGLHHLFAPIEVGDAEASQRWQDQYVVRFQRFELRLGVLAHHQVDRLIHHVDHGEQVLGRFQWHTQVDDDDVIDAHLSRHVDGHVVDHAAVDQQATVHFHRGEHRRDRHAGAHHLRQVAAAHDHLFTRDHIGGHGAIRDRQMIEIAGGAAMYQQTFQQQRQVLALDHAQRQAKAAVVAKAEFLLDQKITVVLLAAKGDVLAWR